VDSERHTISLIITRITSRRDLVSTIHALLSIRNPRLDTVHVAVHHGEGPTLEYREKLLAVVSHEDLSVKQRNV
jgi:hypothetical protein